MFLMWIGEQITSRGIGNGVSLIIMAGIVAQLPQRDRPAVRRRPHRLAVAAADHRLIVVLAVALILVHLLHGARAAAGADPISQAPDRARQMQQERSHLPLKLNTAGVIPPIFASSLLLMPLTVAQFAGNRAQGAGAARTTG